MVLQLAFPIHGKEHAMIKSMLLAAGVSLAIVSTAAAVTPPSKPGATVSSDLVQVKRKWHGDGWRGKRNKHWRHNHYRRHYGHAPRGWNRYPVSYTHLTLPTILRV